MAKGGGSAGAGGSRSSSSSATAAAHRRTPGSRKHAGPVQRARDKTRRQGPRLVEDPANDERQLAAQLRRLGLYPANTLGDGSCLFRALSDQLHGHPNHHVTIRHEVCNFLLDHRDEFIAFIDDSIHSSPEAAFAAHVAEMRQTGTYGTQVEIVAFARMVRRRVKVIQAELVYVIGYEDESPTAREKRALRRESTKGKQREDDDDLPDLYIVYHNWEHYSSARNLQGPHTGLPCIVEQKPSPAEAGSANADDTPVASREESLILSSLRYPHRHSVPEIRRLIHDHGGAWESALEHLLENELDETESEDFNNPSPQPPQEDASLPVPVPMDLGIAASSASSSPSASRLHGSQNGASHHHGNGNARHPASGLAVIRRSSSPSASSSTATSTTHQSTSTTATQLSDLAGEFDLASRIKAASASLVPSNTHSCASSATRVRSRAASPDLDAMSTESPRQRFKITREPLEKEDSSSAAGDDFATAESSSVRSVSTGSNAGDSDPADTGASRFTRPELVIPDERPASVPLIVKRGPGRPPKKRDGLVVPRAPTRRQRKQFAKAGGSPIGSRTRSKAGTPKEDSGLQREFRELYV